MHSETLYPFSAWQAVISDSDNERMKKVPLLQTQPNSTTLILSLPDLHKVRLAKRKGALQIKAGEVQHNLHVGLHNDREDTVSIAGVVVRIVG